MNMLGEQLDESTEHVLQEIAAAGRRGDWRRLAEIIGQNESENELAAAVEAMLSIVLQEELKPDEEEAWVPGAIDAVISAMKRGSLSVNEKLARGGCEIFRLLSTNNNVATKIGEEGAIAIIVAAMRAHLDSLSVQEHACAALINLSRGNRENDSLIFKAEGIPAIVAAMRAHPNSLVIQELACQALNCGFANIFHIARARGVSAIVAAMRAHPNSCVIQEQACKALRDLTDNEEIVGMILGAGGIPAVVAAMRTHLDRLEIQKKGCLVILSLIANEYEFGGIVSEILEEGAIPVLIAAMRAHRDCLEMQTLAFNVFRMLNMEDIHGNCKEELRKAGGIAAIVAAIRGHPDSRELQGIGWMMLVSLQTSHEDETQHHPWESLESWNSDDQSDACSQLVNALCLERCEKLRGYRRKPRLYSSTVGVSDALIQPPARNGSYPWLPYG